MRDNRSKFRSRSKETKTGISVSIPNSVTLVALLKGILLTLLSFISFTRSGIIVIYVVSSDTANAVSLLISFKSLILSCTVMEVESFKVCIPAFNVYIVTIVAFLVDTRVIPVTLNVEASTVSSKVNSSVSVVKFKLKLTSDGSVSSGSNSITFNADSVSISTTTFSFMSIRVVLSKAR